MRLIRSAALMGAGVAGYSVIERHRFRLRILDLPVDPPVPPMSVLHLSDTHLTARNHRLSDFLQSLPELLDEVPDLVLVTGDMVEEDGGIDGVVEGLSRVEARLGRFYVLGSHDYYRSRLIRLVTRWFGPRVPSDRNRIATARLEEGLAEKGWIALTNRTEILHSGRGRIRLAGVDDPFLDLHRTEHIARSSDDVIAIGLVHAPDVVSEWALHGFDLVVAGHTHGGQVRLPGVGAVVTNCSLPAGLAAGAHRIGKTWLHVSPGLGTGRYTAIRFNCRPEATLLRLMQRV